MAALVLQISLSHDRLGIHTELLVKKHTCRPNCEVLISVQCKDAGCFAWSQGPFVATSFEGNLHSPSGVLVTPLATP